MTKNVNLQHRHFVLIAATIASLPDFCNRSVVAQHFASQLAMTNPRFDRARFLACAMGEPVTGRDCMGER